MLCSHTKKFINIIDTSPDIKNQFLKNKINLSAIIYTHEHADQTSGIFEMRPFFGKTKEKFVYGSQEQLTLKKYTFCFKQSLVINQL